MSALLQPEERVLATLNADGSRRWINPRLVQGPLRSRRRVVGWVLILLFVTLPHVHVGGRQWFFMNIADREFTFFGKTFLPTDTLILALAMIAMFVAVFFVTAVVGRVWCGWACPQTVYLDFVFRPIDRLLGYAKNKKGALAGLPLGVRRAIRFVVYTAISFFLANTFLAYFVGSGAVRDWAIHSPLDHLAGFGFVVAITGLMLFNFMFFREQLCMIACPYGRFQSVMLDESSLIVGYDPRRGEPRGKKKRRSPRRTGAGGAESGNGDLSLKIVQEAPVGVAPDSASGADREDGDCVDCGLCVAVCPTGIDIRDGLQMECIHCAACIDACNSVMTKVGRDPGLIRYGSERTLTGRAWSLLRPRVVVYPVLLAVLLTAMTLVIGDKSTFDALVLRERGLPFNTLPSGEIANQARLRLTNRSGEPRTYTVRAPEGLEVRTDELPVTIDPRETWSARALIVAESGYFAGEDGAGGSRRVELVIEDDRGDTRTARFRMFGPAGAGNGGG